MRLKKYVYLFIPDLTWNKLSYMDLPMAFLSVLSLQCMVVLSVLGRGKLVLEIWHQKMCTSETIFTKWGFKKMCSLDVFLCPITMFHLKVITKRNRWRFRTLELLHNEVLTEIVIQTSVIIGCSIIHALDRVLLIYQK